MNQRPLGRTGLQVSEIGYGAWGIGQSMWLGADDDESVRALNRAADLGVTMFDTALAYGDGHSEELVGALARERDIVVATKIPPKNMRWPAADGTDPDDAFPADYVIASTERSLRNLGLDTVDVQQFHVWSDEWVDRGSWRDGIEQLKADGKIRAFGVSINDHQPANAIKLIESGAVDTVQVIYNVFDQSPEDALLDACAEHGIGVLARVPFDEGGLTGKVTPETTFPKDDWRNFYFKGDRKREVFVRAQKVAADLGIALDGLAEAALRFTLSNPAVSTVIPGMRTVKNAEANCRAADGRGLSQDQIARLRPHRWIRNYYKK